MKQISSWAKGHVWTSRLLIVLIIYPVLNIAGWLLGDILQSQAIIINAALAYPLLVVVIIAFALYPSRHGYKHSYTLRKSLDCVLITASFCFVMLSGNHFESSVSLDTSTNSYASFIEKPAHAGKEKIKKQKKRSLLRIINELRKKYRKASDGTKVGLIILAVLVFLGLVLLLGALSCNIACSGSEAGAYVVFFLGLAGLIWALTAVIKRIKKGPRKKPVQDKAPNQT